jgi:serine/threonine protein kinase
MKSNGEETDNQLSTDNIIIDNVSKPQAIVWQAGQKLHHNTYTIIKARPDRPELGGGGSAIIYLAKDNKDRKFVIKTLNESSQTVSKLAKTKIKFENEIKILGLCKHTNIVQMENHFCEDHLPCIVLEYIKGQTLMDLVQTSGALSEEVALLYIEQIGEALKCVHNKNFLHRDVNPNNIILRADSSEVVLIDFGTSKEDIPDSTQPYTVELTHSFAPPEQYDKNSKHGNYTDVYALAATMFYLVTGEYPTTPSNRLNKPDFIPQNLDKQNISDTVKYAIIKGLELKIRDRPQSVDEWFKSLDSSKKKNVKDWNLKLIGLMGSQIISGLLGLSLLLNEGFIAFFTLGKPLKKDGSSLVEHSSPTVKPVQGIYTFKCVYHQEVWAIIAKRGNAISSSPIITFNSTEFGAWTLQKRCSTVAQRLTDIVAENVRDLDNLYLTTGKVNAYTVVCLLKQNQSSCHIENILFTINQQNVKDPKEILEMITNFSRLSNSSTTVIETGNLPQFIPLKALVERSFM